MQKCKRCASYAINHHRHGRDGSDPDLCDVCYWRSRAELALAAIQEKAQADLDIQRPYTNDVPDATSTGRQWYSLRSPDSLRMGFTKDSLFVSRPCEDNQSKCDCCALQMVCQYEFANGSKCPVIGKGEAWLRVDPLPSRQPSL